MIIYRTDSHGNSSTSLLVSGPTLAFDPPWRALSAISSRRSASRYTRLDQRSEIDTDKTKKAKKDR
jgi:hypothetical protein